MEALAIAEVARRVGLPLNAVRSMYRRGRMPVPDVVVGGSTQRPVHGWLPETIDGWAYVRERARNRP